MWEEPARPTGLPLPPPPRSHCLKLGVCTGDHLKQGPDREERLGTGELEGQWGGRKGRSRDYTTGLLRNFSSRGLQTVLSKILRICLKKQIQPIRKGLRLLEHFNLLRLVPDLWLTNQVESLIFGQR